MSVSSLRINYAANKKKSEATVHVSVPKLSPSFSTLPAETMDPKLAVQKSLLSPEIDSKTRTPMYGPYCSQVPSQSMNETVYILLSDLMRFQLRARNRNPAKAQSKRRLVSGISECTRHLLASHIKLLIIATDIEESALSDSDWVSLMDAAMLKSSPIIYAMSRRALGGCIGQDYSNISVVGILNTDGANHNYQQAITDSMRLAKIWHETAVELLADELAVDKREYPLFMQLINYGHESVLRAVESQVRNRVNSVDPYSGSTPVMIAASRGWYRLVEYFIGLQADLNTCDFCLSTPLVQSCEFGRVQCTKIILSHYSNNIDKKDAARKSALMRAIEFGSSETIGLLLSSGCKVDEQLLRFYCENTWSLPWNTIIKLIQRTKSPLQDTLVHGLLLSLAKNGQLESVRCLLSTCACPLKVLNMVDEDLKSVTWWTAYLGYVGLTRELIRRGAVENFTASLPDGSKISVTDLLQRCK